MLVGCCFLATTLEPPVTHHDRMTELMLPFAVAVISSSSCCYHSVVVEYATDGSYSLCPSIVASVTVIFVIVANIYRA